MALEKQSHQQSFAGGIPRRANIWLTKKRIRPSNLLKTTNANLFTKGNLLSHNRQGNIGFNGFTSSAITRQATSSRFCNYNGQSDLPVILLQHHDSLKLKLNKKFVSMLRECGIIILFFTQERAARLCEYILINISVITSYVYRLVGWFFACRNIYKIKGQRGRDQLLRIAAF